MRRLMFFGFGVACHALFLVVYAWMGAFLGNVGPGWITKMDGLQAESLGGALLVDALLIAAFAVPHSVMARPTFKRWWTKFVPEPIERSTYVLVSCLLMALLLRQWRPVGGVVWDVQSPTGRILVTSLFVFGWLMVPAVSLMINHFDLFGTRQVWLYLRGRAYSHLPFRTPMAYRFVRHPLYVGWTILFWATPTMTVAHLLFAILMTGYMLVAIPFEERNLVEYFGNEYADYRQRVGMFVPRVTGRAEQPEAQPVS